MQCWCIINKRPFLAPRLENKPNRDQKSCISNNKNCHRQNISLMATPLGSIHQVGSDSNIREYSLPPIPAHDHKIVLLHQAAATFLDIFAHIINTAFFRYFEKKLKNQKLITQERN